MHSLFPLRLDNLSSRAIPGPEASYSLPETVPIRVEAFDKQSKMLDVVTLGEFMYWESGSICPQSYLAESYPPGGEDVKSTPPIQTPSSVRADTIPALHRRYSPYPSPSHKRAPPSRYADVPLRLHRRGKARTSFRRARTSNSGENNTARLEFRTPLTDLCQNWDEAEIAAGRRLVYFSSEQRNNTLVVSCYPITPEQHDSYDVVVSCIYREDVDQCFITSVDIIFLLQKLVGEQFTVMEKNRIRRNLEGLRPVTVSKHRAGVSDFFQKIMDFPDPKPRNIEKDLKVFPWHCLDQALNKIISKYSLNPDHDLDPYSPILAAPAISAQVRLPRAPNLLSPFEEDVKPRDRNLDEAELVYPPRDLSLHFGFVNPAAIIGSDPNPFAFGPFQDSSPSSWESEFFDVDHHHTDLRILEHGELYDYSGGFESLV